MSRGRSYGGATITAAGVDERVAGLVFVKMYQFGVLRRRATPIVPDQARALIKRPDRYNLEPDALYDELAADYGCALLTARPTHPRDKPKVANAVLVVERWILARLRNRRFFSIGELNAAIALLMVDLNQCPFKKLPGFRRSAFDERCCTEASSVKLAPTP